MTLPTSTKSILDTVYFFNGGEKSLVDYALYNRDKELVTSEAKGLGVPGRQKKINNLNANDDVYSYAIAA